MKKTYDFWTIFPQPFLSVSVLKNDMYRKEKNRNVYHSQCYRFKEGLHYYKNQTIKQTNDVQGNV
jgi:hypothetical protein